MDKFEWLSRYVFRDYIRKLDDLESNFGYDFVSFESEKSKWRGKDGFSSDALVGHIVYTDSKGKIHRTKSMIVKLMLEPHNRTKYIDLVFNNEVFVYTKIIPFFSRINDQINNLFPTFYHSSLSLLNDDEEGSIMLENLNESGYKLSPSKLFLDLQHLELALKKLGQFHAYSYRMKTEHSRTFFSLVDQLKETHNTCTKETPKNYFTILNDTYMQHLENDIRYKYKVPVIRRILNDPQEFMEHVFSSREEPWAVVCHGDFLRNNFLFQYDDQGNPQDVKFIDLANSRYCSPIVDLSSVLYMNTDQNTRNLHWDRLIDTYYNSLTNTFPDNTQVPSRKQILQEFAPKSLLTYLCASFFIPMMLEAEQNPNPNWLKMLYIPEFEQYKNVGWFAVPSHVSTGLIFKILTKERIEKVLDILRDMTDRGFI